MVQRTCTYPKCEKRHEAKGYCKGHYRQHQRGIPLRPLRQKRPDICIFPECVRPHLAKGYCNGHYMQLKNDRPLAPLGRRSTSLIERFESYIEETPHCWNWTGFIKPDGYGLFRVGNKNVMAHRFAHETWAAPIPDGMFIDHQCHNRKCVNPSHLRLVTHKQNHENRAGTDSRNVSGYRGVSWNSAQQKWVAQVVHNKVHHNLGLFDDPAEAGEAARLKRLELFTHNDLDRIA